MTNKIVLGTKDDNMRISVQTLVDHDACEEQVELFKEFLGDRKFILDTPRNIRLAAKFGIEVRWAIKELGLQMPDGPLENSDGSIHWHLNGKRHREDGPALIRNNSEEWFLNGLRHREDGPAIICGNRVKEWWLNGRLHREDGPALIWNGRAKMWYLKGQLHREDGPALIRKGRAKRWYLNGVWQPNHE